jgi:hypothetical protein
MNGLLLTMTEPTPEMEEEFNAWYDTEHMAERLAIPGFISARRWVFAKARPGTGKYLATYELSSPEVLTTPEYLAHVGEHFTPWSKRCLAKAALFRRWAATQTLPGNALPVPAAKALMVAMGDSPAEHEAEFNKWYDEEHLPMLAAVPGVLSARRFFDPAGKPRYIALYELTDRSVVKSPQWQASVATPWSKRMLEATSKEEWILRCYDAYEAAEAKP